MAQVGYSTGSMSACAQVFCSLLGEYIYIYIYFLTADSKDIHHNGGGSGPDPALAQEVAPGIEFRGSLGRWLNWSIAHHWCRSFPIDSLAEFWYDRNVQGGHAAHKIARFVRSADRMTKSS